MDVIFVDIYTAVSAIHKVRLCLTVSYNYSAPTVHLRQLWTVLINL